MGKRRRSITFIASNWYTACVA